MARNPNWTAEDAATFLARVAVDDVAAEPFRFDDPEPSLDASGSLRDTLAPETDAIDIVAVDLERDALYSFLVQGTTLPVLRILDAEGYLLEATDSAVFGIEPLGTDTIYQFRPETAGRHYIAVSFADPGRSGTYAFAGEVDLPEVDAETGNTQPLATDLTAAATTFAAIRIEPLADAFDADGDTLALTGVGPEPGNGVAVIDGDAILYRSASGFAGIDTLGFTVSDGETTDDGVILVSVATEDAAEGVTRAEAQVVAFLYEAGLDRNGEIDQAGLDFWIGALEGTFTMEDIAAAFLRSDEFEAAFGDPGTLSDRALVERFYLNVLDRDGEAEGVDFWTGLLEDGAISRPSVLIAFAQSAENLAGSPEVAEIAQAEDGSWVLG